MSNLQKRAKRALFLMPLLITVLLEGTKHELLTAACKNKEDYALWLVRHEFTDFKDLDSNGWSPFHYAVKNNMGKLVNCLLETHQFDVNQPTKHNWYPVHIAAFYGNLDILKRLQKSGAKIDVVLENDGECHNAFTLAARKKHKDVMVYCLSLMPFAWTEDKYPSFTRKVCFEMRKVLTKEILGVSAQAEIADLDLLTSIMSRWLQKGGNASYFSKLTHSQEAKISGLIISDYASDQNFSEMQQCSLLLLQYLKFFFYKKNGSSKKSHLRELTIHENILRQKFALPVLSIETAAQKYFLNNLKKSVLKQNEYARKSLRDLTCFFQ